MNVLRDCAYCSLPVRLARRVQPRDEFEHAVYCCYGCRFAAAVTQSSGEQASPRRVLSALGISVFLTMNVMMFSLALYSQDVYGRESHGTTALATNLTAVMRYLSLLLATPVFVLLGLPILMNSIDQLRQRIVSTDGLVVLGVAASFVYSYVSTLGGGGGIYYETACVILLLMTIGRYLEAQGKLQASAAIKRLASMLPDIVEVRRGEEIATVPLGDVQCGDSLIIRPGSRIPVDGFIGSGRGNIDEQIITGESIPVAKAAGARVYAGSLNTDGLLEVTVTALGKDSTLSRLVSLVDDARRAKGRYERLADRVTALFVPIVVVLAIVAVAVHWHRASPAEGLMAGLAVLLISCPCALGVATPLAVWAALGRAAEDGILFRKGDALEQLAEVRAVAFDKTGTLTTGAPTVRNLIVDVQGAERTKWLSEVAGLAAASPHPYSVGLRSYFDDLSITPAKVDDVRSVAGVGMEATSDGTPIRLGSHTIVDRYGLSVSTTLHAAMHDAAQRGDAMVCMAVGDRLIGVCGLTEQLRDEAAGAINTLKSLGYCLEVLTGDHPQRGQLISDALGIAVRAELRPEAKANRLAEIRRDVGAVAMVGDGLNDAPALAAADVGIAMGCGADLTRDAAQVCLLSNNLGSVVTALRLSREAVRTIRANLFWAFFYNIVGMGLAMTGRLSPMFAAAAMMISSLLVVGNSLRPARLGRKSISTSPSAALPSSEPGLPGGRSMVAAS